MATSREVAGKPRITPRVDAVEASGFRRARGFVGVFWLCLALGSACERRVEEPPSERVVESARVTPGSGSSAEPVPSGAAGRASSATSDAPEAEAIELLVAAGSAYHVVLEADADGFYALASDAAYRLKPGAAPVRLALDLGFGSSVMADSLLFWSAGAIFRAPTSGGKPKRLATLPERPQGFFSSDAAFAWLERAEDGRGRLRALAGPKPFTSYTAPGPIDAVTMLNASIFFAERVGASSFRIGAVPVAGGTPAFTEPRRGRSPSALVGKSELYYYDGNGFVVRKLSPDLKHEDTVASNLVCSPIAVAGERVYCGSVEGIVELSDGKRRSLVRGARRSPVVAISANASHVAWLGEAGPNQWVVKALPLQPR